MGGLASPMLNPELDVGIEFFYNLSIGVTYQELVAELGEPTGFTGSGIVRPFHKVDGVFICMFFLLNDEGEYGYLVSMDVFNEVELLYCISLNDEERFIQLNSIPGLTITFGDINSDFTWTHGPILSKVFLGVDELERIWITHAFMIQDVTAIC